MKWYKEQEKPKSGRLERTYTGPSTLETTSGLHPATDQAELDVRMRCRNMESKVKSAQLKCGM